MILLLGLFIIDIAGCTKDDVSNILKFLNPIKDSSRTSGSLRLRGENNSGKRTITSVEDSRAKSKKDTSVFKIYRKLERNMFRKYPDCNVKNPSNLANGYCNCCSYNTKECGYDGGDCLNPDYPQCTGVFPESIGDGECDGGHYNTEECEYDGGDCLKINHQYPDCKNVTEPYNVGNGICDAGQYNTPGCGYDGGDCIEFNEKCNVENPHWIRDGYCDEEEVGYNTPQCNWDGGDCFLRDFVDGEGLGSLLKKSCYIKDRDSTRIQDGICDGKWNTKDCNFDGGDCIDFNEKYPDCSSAKPSEIG